MEDLSGIRYDGRVLSIGLDKKYGVDDTLTYTIAYSTIPKRGLFFVSPDSAYPYRPPQVWSQSQPEDTRDWFPCHDYPDDFLSSSLTATVPEDWVVVSNGTLEKVSSDPKGERVTFRWVEPRPHVVYLISIVAGKYRIMKYKSGKIPVSYYVAARDTECAKYSFKYTPDVIKFYSDLTGHEYPWEKLSLATVSNYTSGAMENVSAITFGEEYLGSPDDGPLGQMNSLLAHEVAHQWIGDLLTCRSWDHIWLNEGFADYLDILFEGNTFGADYFVSGMSYEMRGALSADRAERRPMVCSRYFESDDIFWKYNAYNYLRGADVLNMLRGVLGDNVFKKVLKYYVNKYQFQCVDTHDFETAVQEASGQNLDWFFDEWAYKAGHPSFTVSYDYNDTTHLITLNVDQTQKVDSLTPIFKMPVDVLIATPDGKVTQRVWVGSLHNSYVFNLQAKPLMVDFDERNFLSKMRVVAFQIFNR